MNVIFMNKEEKVTEVLINPKIAIRYDPNYKLFLITVNDVSYPTPYDDNTFWNFKDDWGSFILMQTDKGWIVDRANDMLFHGRDFEHYAGL